MAQPATPTPTPATPTPPAGGYKEGGWYGGQRFMGGQLLPAGQDTAGHQVSAEVNQQSSQLQVPNNPNAVQDYLNNYQKNVQQSISGSTLTGNNSEQVMGQAINDNRPTPPNLAQDYGQLAGQYNLTGLNAQMTSLQQQQNQIQTSIETEQNKNENQPGVTADVVAGRESEAKRQAQIQLDSINLQMNTVSQQITNANNTIGMIMNFTQQDYTNASQAYNDSFNQSYQMQQLLQQQQQIDLSKQSEQFNEQAKTQQIAAANWTTMSNLIASGQVDMNNLTPSQQSHIQSLETQAGLPQGITQQILSNTAAGSKIISADSQTGQAIIQQPNGKVSVMDIPGQELAPVKLANGYMYTFDKATGQYQFVPGQVTGLDYLWKAASGTLPPQTIQAGGGAVLTDPKTGNQYQYQSTSDPDYQADLKKGYKAL